MVESATRIQYVEIEGLFSVRGGLVAEVLHVWWSTLWGG